MLRWIYLSVIVVIVDQVTKIWADNNLEMFEVIPIFKTMFNSGLNVTLAYNTGAAYSFLNDLGGVQHYIFGGLAILVSLYIVYTLYTLSKAELQQAVALSFVLGGAVGNLIDRVLYQHVIDFINIYINNIHLFGIFNIADVAISMGAILLILEMIGFKILKSKVNQKLNS